MLENLSLYVVLATIVPGSLLVCVVAVLFSDGAAPPGAMSIADDFALLAVPIIASRV